MDEFDLAARVRAMLPAEGIREQRMFGGICFMLNGNMAAGTMARGELLVRVGPAGLAGALARPGARVMAMRDRPMKGFVIVAAPALAGDEALRDWLALGLATAAALPPK